jgi:nicotinate-nucleotide--dimethylbenzimidazole phosphoribosyltransferase
MERLRKSVASIKPLNEVVYRQANQRLANQARPAGSLGLLETASARLAAIFGTLDVRLGNKIIVTCAGDHGVTVEGVSLFPQEVTAQMVFNFVNGGASINVLGRHAGARVVVADLGVNFDFDPGLPIFHKKVGKGTANFACTPAMRPDQAVRSVEAGIEIIDELLAQGPVDLLGIGDMGIGNTTAASAVIAAFSGVAVDTADRSGHRHR